MIASPDAMSVVYFLAMVGLLVAIHELGHFVAAKAVGVKVLRFSLGFGPPIVRVRAKGTEYQIGAVPLGGYVRMLGEDPSEVVAEDDRAGSFSDKPLWQRLVVVFAGPAANLLFPFVVYFAFFAGDRDLPAAVVGDVLAGGPAAEAGVEPGDRVLEINGKRVRYWEELESLVDGHAGQMLRFKIRRGDKDVFAYMAPRTHVLRDRAGSSSEQGLIGVVQAPFPPEIGVLDPASPAARAGLRTGDRIVSVDGRPVESYGGLERALRASWKRAPIALLRPEKAPVGFAEITLYRPLLADLAAEKHDGQVATGIAPSELFVAAVAPGTPAARAGLVAGDLLVALDGQPIRHWMLLEQALLGAPERSFHLTWRRGLAGGGAVDLEADIVQERRAAVDEYGQSHALIVFGAENDVGPVTGERVPIDSRFSYAAVHALDRTAQTTILMARGLVSLVRGQLPRDTIGGPIMVFRMASVSGHKGWDEFLLMLALISVNLGLLNLLPIPILDGGHVVMFAIEAVRRRRVSPRVRDGFVMAGLVVIVSLTVLALKNDIVRYLLH
jgi:regulator of sigma E protease